MTENDLATCVLDLSFKIHRKLGPGLLESAYQKCLIYELQKGGMLIDVEKKMPVIYEEIEIDNGYRIDILIENKLVLELKSVSELNENHKAQLLTYLRLGNYKLGLLINFREVLLKNGIKRVANKI